MNKKLCYLRFLYASILMLNVHSYAEKASDRVTLEALDTHNKKSDDSTTFSFSYTNEDLVNILYALSLKSKTTLLLPQGGNAINVKITYDAGRQLTYDEAWNLVVSFLDVAGYATIKKDDSYQITKMNKEITREGLPVFIGTDLLSAPTNDEQIVYVHYFTNMKASQEGNSEVQEILKLLFPEGAKFVIDSAKNAVIMAARARDIHIAVNILTELDKAGFKEKIDKLKLHHTSARFVADLFNEHFLQQEDGFNRNRLDTRKRSENSFFAPQTRIVAYDRLNTLIMIGQDQAIERIKNFITEQIDVEPESGKSILHVYRLQYLDAETFAPVLQKIVEGTPAQSTGQSKADGKRPTGPEKFFDEVIVTVDKPTNAEELRYYGGNNLIIACRNDDWQVIRDLIESLDIQQPQVFIEVLIADLTSDDSRVLGSILRNPTAIKLPNGMDFQSAMISPGVIVEQATIDNKTVNTTIQSDVLELQPTGTGSETTSPIIANMAPGSTAISISDSDGKTWTALQILKLFSNSKIISHPHLIATHNKAGEVKIGQYRLVAGDITGSIGSNTVRKQEPITADLTVKITPRISAESAVNLEVEIHIEEFLPGTSNAKITRTVKTNANVESESILTLGGLIRTTTRQGFSKTPVLGDIPVLGWFFKARAGDREEDNLTIFICPTIIRQQSRKAMGEYTQDYINIVHQYAEESVLFDSIREPITRLYFGTTDTFQEVVDDFVVEDQYIQQEAIMPEELAHAETAQKKRRKKKAVVVAKDTHAKENDTPKAAVSTKTATPVNAASTKSTLEETLLAKIAQDENPFKKELDPKKDLAM